MPESSLVRLRAAALLAVCLAAFGARADYSYRLAFTEDFRKQTLSSKVWSRIPEQKHADWAKPQDDKAPGLVVVKNGILQLWGIRNPDTSADPRQVLCGGIWTKGHLGMQYGRVEVKVRFHDAQGAWPAVWMMPMQSVKGWPGDGEIDLIERLNGDAFLYQTVHSNWTQRSNDPPRGRTAAIRPKDWNIVSLEWTPEGLTWYVNGEKTHSYPRIGDDPDRYPWTKPFYLMLDMQLGGSWVGAPHLDQLPVMMEIDYVKWYALYDGTKKLTRFTRD